MPRPLRSSTLFAAVLLLAGNWACIKQTAVWVIPGSTSAHLMFGLGKNAGRERPGYVGMLAVQRCGNHGDRELLVWLLEPARGGSGPGLPGRVTYGSVPEGFVEHAPAPFLQPGAYIAYTDGSGSVWFAVTDSGAVQALERCTGAAEPSDSAPVSGR